MVRGCFNKVIALFRSKVNTQALTDKIQLIGEAVARYMFNLVDNDKADPQVEILSADLVSI